MCILLWAEVASSSCSNTWLSLQDSSPFPLPLPLGSPVSWTCLLPLVCSIYQWYLLLWSLHLAKFSSFLKSQFRCFSSMKPSYPLWDSSPCAAVALMAYRLVHILLNSESLEDWNCICQVSACIRWLALHSETARHAVDAQSLFMGRDNYWSRKYKNTNVVFFFQLNEITFWNVYFSTS